MELLGHNDATDLKKKAPGRLGLDNRTPLAETSHLIQLHRREPSHLCMLLWQVVGHAKGTCTRPFSALQLSVLTHPFNYTSPLSPGLATELLERSCGLIGLPLQSNG